MIRVDGDCGSYLVAWDEYADMKARSLILILGLPRGISGRKARGAGWVDTSSDE